ncbi:hypothetical protein BH11PSE9_BH11PSE9_37160 [soil metagenome]
MRNTIATTFKFTAWMLVIAMLVSVALVAIGATWSSPFHHAVIDIDGDTFTLGEWTALHGGDWVLAVGGVMLALLVVLFVVPFAVLVPLTIVALCILAALFTVAGVAMLVMSPMLLVVWIVWRLARGPKRRVSNTAATSHAAASAGAADATMTR